MNLNKFFYTNFPEHYGKVNEFLETIYLPLKLLLFYLNFDIFFSSKSQDKWIVKEIFNYKKNGYFLDLAATNGISENNTFYLEKRLNWNGICIEPNKKFFKKLRKRRKVKCLCEVVGHESEEIDFLSLGGTGGIIGDEYDNNFLKREKRIKKAITENKIEKRNSRSLVSILDEINAPKIIDYFSLDIEGAEEIVLKNFPFEKYKFLALTIERPSPLINQLLKKNNYTFVKNFKVDGFYIHESIKNKVNLKFEKFYQIEKKSW
tara:strand:- start:488 stop:1273 length:786 start_codon:yes stop_codon:yes gene_type:complete